MQSQESSIGLISPMRQAIDHYYPLRKVIDKKEAILDVGLNYAQGRSSNMADNKGKEQVQITPVVVPSAQVITFDPTKEQFHANGVDPTYVRKK